MALMNSIDLGKRLKIEDYDNLYFFYGHDVGALGSLCEKADK